MIHFFPTFSDDASDSPFAKALANQDTEYRIFSGEVVFRYKNRIWLPLVGWPKLTGFACRSAIKSLLRSKPYPDAVVLESHIEVLIFGLLRAILFRKKPSIILAGFILTERKNAFINKFRHFYFNKLFSFTDKVICYSSPEVEEYSKLFATSGTRFSFIPYGLHIDGREPQSNKNLSNELEGSGYILSAGRSERDYETLFQAIKGLDVTLHVVCDSEDAIAGLSVPPNAIMLRDVYGDNYVMQLKNASFVVIPLSTSNISAGQMVLIQAMAFGKPVIITRTPTVQDYVEDGVDAILVKLGDVNEMRLAIKSLSGNKQLQYSLSKNALTTFDTKYTLEAYVNNLMDQTREYQ